MKIFISWSVEKSNSHEIAKFLRAWLPDIIQVVEPYVSSEDIEKGANWFANVRDELKTSTYGILCITKQNIKSPWMHFEAGALADKIGRGNICPLLIDLEPSEVTGPLSQFQSAKINKEDILKGC